MAAPHGWDLRLGDDEIAVLQHVLGEVEAMLRTDDAVEDSTPEWARDLGLNDLSNEASMSPPEDPALARLLPDGSRDDDLIARDFRRLTEAGLRATKREAIGVAMAVLDGAADGVVTLSAMQASALLRALTDVRLVLAERLGLQTDEDSAALHEWLARDIEQDGADGDDDSLAGARRWLAMVYEFLTELQQVLADLLLRDVPPEGDGRRRPPPTERS